MPERTCPDCMAHTTDPNHICPPWLKVLVSDYKRRNPGKDPRDIQVTEESVMPQERNTRFDGVVERKVREILS
jgi:hypothetical protein